MICQEDGKRTLTQPQSSFQQVPLLITDWVSMYEFYTGANRSVFSTYCEGMHTDLRRRQWISSGIRNFLTNDLLSVGKVRPNLDSLPGWLKKGQLLSSSRYSFVSVAIWKAFKYESPVRAACRTQRHLSSYCIVKFSGVART